MRTRRNPEPSRAFFALLVALSALGCGRASDDESDSPTWRNLESAAAADPNLFASGFAGVAVTKPPEWRFVANDEISNVRREVKLEKAKFEEMMRRAQLPVVSIMKYPEPYAGVNPTVQIGVRSKKYYPTTNPRDLLAKIVSTMQSSQALQGLTVTEAERSMKIDGIPASTVSFRFNLRLGSGESWPVLTKMYYAINSENVIIVGMSGPDSGADQSEEEFDSILQSLRLSR